MKEIKTAFNLVADKVYSALKEQGFGREKVADSDKEMVALFTGEAVAYSVVYHIEKTRMVLCSCRMTDDGPDNSWKTLATWLFDPETDGTKEAESIANDFVDTVTASSAVKRVKQAKKKKGDDGNADPLFLAKRFVTFFPELKDIIKEEQETYEQFRGVYFTRTYVIDRVNSLIDKGAKGEVSKLAQMISTQYANGDKDTRSIITIVILNSIEEKHIEKFNALLSEELQKAWGYALKMKGKKVRPEKEAKNRYAYAADTLR